MTQIARQTTWASLQTLTASALNAEFNNVVNAWNNHDSGASRWTVMDATTIKKSGTTLLTVFQTITATTTSGVSLTANSTVATNLAATITPSSTANRILVIASGSFRITGTSLANGGATFIKRGTTDLSAGANFSNSLIQVSGQAVDCSVAINYVDSPATTSATTYTVWLFSNTASNTLTFPSASQVGSITLMEVG